MAAFIFGLLILALMIYLSRKQAGGPAGIFSYGKSRAKLLTEDLGKATFADVAGIDEAKEELEEIVEYLGNPEVFTRLGAKIPKGALLVGPPGTGKTLLARAIAGEAGVPFFTISGSDFVEMFVGVGASRVRDMFEQAKRNAPCIVFIDEIDAVGRSRGIGIGGGNDEREQTLNQLLVEMDGFESNDGVVIIAATNRPDVLDTALTRPGRFDRQVFVPKPDLKGREAILMVHGRKVALGDDVDFRVLARGTPGFSGADLSNLVNEAALRAARARQRFVLMEDFEKAKDKVLLGSERRSLLISADERRLTAYHEAGHAIVGMNVPQHDPVYKVSVIPRGGALGVMVPLPEKDHHTFTMTKLMSRIKMAMGGKAAEEIVFGPENVSTGAKSDLQMATDIARQMVAEFGMSPKLGNVSYGADSGSPFGNVGKGGSTSEDSKKLIEEETRRIMGECWDAARSILTERRADLDRLAEGLLEYETLTGDEITRLLAGDDLKPVTVAAVPSVPRRKATVTQFPRAGKGKPRGPEAAPEH